MAGKELLERLLDSYEASYDIEKGYSVPGHVYDAYAGFRVTSARYVLMKKAELWRANCFEHVFFSVKDELTPGDIERFREQVAAYIEPELVRGGNRWPPKNHMYTYITGIYICENGISAEGIKAVKGFRYVRNYKLTIRGYSEVRILVFDMRRKKIFGNRAARDLVKGYTKARAIWPL